MTTIYYIFNRDTGQIVGAYDADSGEARASANCEAIPAPPPDSDLAALHMWLVHGDGSICEDGCDAAPLPARAAVYRLIG